MSFRIRAALPKDIRALYDLAKLTGGGFTNLPAERATLEAKLERSEAGFSRKGENPADDLYMFMLENVRDRRKFAALVRCSAKSATTGPSTAI